MPDKKRIAIVGAGPGGLTSAMLLAARGFDVTVFEQKDRVGGRNSSIRLGQFIFDVGPTFLMLKQILDEVFEEANRKSFDYLEFKQLEPMYRLQYPDFVIEPTTDRQKMREQLEGAFPGIQANAGLDRYYRVEKRRFDLMYPCLQKDYASLGTMFHRDLRRALPHLSLGRSLMGVLGDYFKPELARLAFTFQAKYLGMSPWDCPGLFGLLSYIEHAFGIFHVTGGLSEISLAMAKVVQEHGGVIRLNTPVKQLLLDGRTVRGVELVSGEKVPADDVIINADFAHAMTHLVPAGALRKWTPSAVQRKRFSCSTFMLYLGVDKIYDLPHHTIVFAKSYRQNVEDIFKNKRLSRDVSIYIRNACVNDPKIAPKGKSAVYILVPVANQTSGIDWAQEKTAFRKLVLDTIQSKTIMNDLEKHIEVEKMITPVDWVSEYSVYNGATFNLGHNLTQMLYLRPRNRFEEFKHCYLVGGGTHPGSGLPTIYESGRISANLISKYYGVPFSSKNLHV
ncbi:MAG: phytoene desaturase family protein [candidate division FCPU426 bacterium]